MRAWASCFRTEAALLLCGATFASAAVAQDGGGFGGGFGGDGGFEGQFEQPAEPDQPALPDDFDSSDPLDQLGQDDPIERALDAPEVVARALNGVDAVDVERLLEAERNFSPDAVDLSLGAMDVPPAFSDWVSGGPDPLIGWGGLIDPDADGNPLVNPPSDPEELVRTLGILPYIMPAGPDGTSPSVPGVSSGSGVIKVAAPAGGAVLGLGNPNNLDWNGGAADASCFEPEAVNPDTLGPQVNGARVLSVLIAGMPGALREIDEGRVAARRLEKCTPGLRNVHTRHCTGLLEPPEGKYVWTAAHCLLNPTAGLAEASLRAVTVGQSLPCSEATGFRAVSLLGLTRDDFVVPNEFIRPCERVERVANDIVRVTLREPLPVIPADGEVVASWRLPKEGELDELLVDGRRLYGTGFLQSAVLYDLMGGRAMPMENCLATLAGMRGDFGPQATAEEQRAAVEKLRGEVPAGALTFGGYGCTSMDTYNGSSGGPVFALAADGSSLVLVGFISAASWTNFEMECGDATSGQSVLQDQCGADPEVEGGLNLFAVLPVPTPWGG